MCGLGRAFFPWPRGTCTSCATGASWTRTAPSSSPCGPTRARVRTALTYARAALSERASKRRRRRRCVVASSARPSAPPPFPHPSHASRTPAPLPPRRCVADPHPEEKGAVRAEVLTAGWVVRPLDPPHCTASACTYFSMADLKARQERRGACDLSTCRLVVDGVCWESSCLAWAPAVFPLKPRFATPSVPITSPPLPPTPCFLCAMHAGLHPQGHRGLGHRPAAHAHPHGRLRPRQRHLRTLQGMIGRGGGGSS